MTLEAIHIVVSSNNLSLYYHDQNLSVNLNQVISIA